MSVNALPIRRVPQQPMRFTAAPGYRPSGSPVVAMNPAGTGAAASPTHAQNGAAYAPTGSQSGSNTPRQREQQREQWEQQAQTQSAPSTPPLAHRPQLVQYSARPALGNPSPAATPRSLGFGSSSHATTAAPYGYPPDDHRRAGSAAPAMLSVVDAAVSTSRSQTPRGHQRYATEQLAQKQYASTDSPSESINATASFDFADYTADTLRLDDDERKGDSERVVKSSSRGSATPRGSNHAGLSTPRNHAGGSSTPRGNPNSNHAGGSSTVPSSVQNTPRRVPRENRATAPSGLTFDVDALNRSPARTSVGAGGGSASSSSSDEFKNDRESTDRRTAPMRPSKGGSVSPDANANVTFNFPPSTAATTARSSASGGGGGGGGSSGNSANGSTRGSPNTSVPPSPTHQRSESAQPIMQSAQQSQLQQLQQQQPPLLRPSTSQQLSQRPSTPRGPGQTAHMQQPQPPIPSRPRVGNRPQLQAQQQPQPARLSPGSAANDRYSAAFASMDVTTPTSANGPSANSSYPMRPGSAAAASGAAQQRSPSNAAFPNGAPQLLVQQSVSMSSSNNGGGLNSAVVSPSNAAAAANGLAAVPANRRHARNVSFADGGDLLHYDDMPAPRVPAAKLARYNRAMFLANGQPKPAMKFSPQPSPREDRIRGAQLSPDALRLHQFRSRQLQESLMIHTVLSGAPLVKFSASSGKPQRRWFFVEETDTEHRICWESVESNPLKNHNGLQSLQSSSSAVATNFAASGASSIASLPPRARRDSSSGSGLSFQIGKWKFNQDRSRSLIEVSAMHYGPFYSKSFGEELCKPNASNGAGSISGSSSSSGGAAGTYPWLCFSLQFPDRTLDLQASSESEVTRWYLGLQGLIPHSVFHLSRGMLLWQRAVMKINYWGLERVKREVMATDRKHHLHTAASAAAAATTATSGASTARGGAAAAAAAKLARQGSAAVPLRRGSSFSLPAPSLVRAGSVGRSLSITLSRRKSQSEQMKEQMKARTIEYDFTSRSS